MLFRSANVRCWHKADIQLTPGNVRFWGNSGHRDFRTSCLLLTDAVEKVPFIPLDHKKWRILESERPGS
jgi:hypothetical protein